MYKADTSAYYETHCTIKAQMAYGGDEKDIIMREAHCRVAGGHYAGDATARKIWQSGLWWLTTLKDAVRYAKE